MSSLFVEGSKGDRREGGGVTRCRFTHECWENPCVACNLNNVSCFTNLEEENSNLTLHCFAVKIPASPMNFWCNHGLRLKPLPPSFLI